jgi:hypothetical protein
MKEDRTLFGQGRYPDSGPLAVMARLAFLSAVLAIAIAVFLPPWMVPRILYSNYLEHFAAFYVAILAGFAAMPRTRVWRIAAAYGLFATVLEGLHLLAGAPFLPLMRNWVADLGGLSAAIAPIVVERFRRRFDRESELPPIESSAPPDSL